MALKISINIPAIEAQFTRLDLNNTSDRRLGGDIARTRQFLCSRFKNFNSENTRGQLLPNGLLGLIRETITQPNDPFKRDGRRLSVFKRIVTPPFKKGGTDPLSIETLLEDDPGSYITLVEGLSDGSSRVSAMVIYRHSRCEMTIFWIGPRMRKREGFKTLRDTTNDLRYWATFEEGSEIL